MRETIEEMQSLANLEKITLVPEYDPLLAQAIGLLKSTAYEPTQDAAAVERTLRAVRLDAHKHSFAYWVPMLIAIFATAIFVFAVVESLSIKAPAHTVAYSRSVEADTFSDGPNVKP